MKVFPCETKKPLVLIAGIRGDKGEDGKSELITAVAGENISALKPCYLYDGKVYQFKNNVEYIDYYLGLSTTAALKDNQITIKTIGLLNDAAFSFNYGRVYLGVDGGLTQIAPTTGNIKLIGSSCGNNDLILKENDFIILE